MPVTQNQTNREPFIVAISLDDYADMVRRIQELEDQLVIENLRRDADRARAECENLRCKLYCTEEKLKEAMKNESV